MATMKAAENSARLLTGELSEPELRLHAARVARAIAERMDPEWREFVAEEQRERRRLASLRRSKLLLPKTALARKTASR